jgi:hypothetical protein
MFVGELLARGEIRPAAHVSRVELGLVADPPACWVARLHLFIAGEPAQALPTQIGLYAAVNTLIA